MLRTILTVLIVLVIFGSLVVLTVMQWAGGGAVAPRERRSTPTPVEVAAIEFGPITEYRTFSGSLEPTARFIAAPKVSGRIRELRVDLADPVRRGQVVAVLDDEEFVQAVNAAYAEVQVSRANATEAANALEIANRALQRVQTLREEGVASESQLDAARAEQLAAESRVAVVAAQLTRAEAAWETAKIRLAYTQVTADWPVEAGAQVGSGDGEAFADEQQEAARVVGERYVNESDTIAANTAMLSIVDLDPILAVLYVTERDYATLAKGQVVTLSTDAWPGRTFAGRIVRISQVFRESSRQARVEIEAANADHALKPGMFVRARVALRHSPEACIVPEAALTRRDDRDGVFVVNESDMSVRWQPVTTAIREEGRVEIRSPRLSGRVVTLGRQVLEDGGKISIAEVAVEQEASAAAVTDADMEAGAQ